MKTMTAYVFSSSSCEEMPVSESAVPPPAGYSAGSVVKPLVAVPSTVAGSVALTPVVSRNGTSPQTLRLKVQMMKMAEREVARKGRDYQSAGQGTGRMHSSGSCRWSKCWMPGKLSGPGADATVWPPGRPNLSWLASQKLRVQA